MNVFSRHVPFNFYEIMTPQIHGQSFFLFGFWTMRKGHVTGHDFFSISYSHRQLSALRMKDRKFQFGDFGQYLFNFFKFFATNTGNLKKNAVFPGRSKNHFRCSQRIESFFQNFDHFLLGLRSNRATFDGYYFDFHGNTTLKFDPFFHAQSAVKPDTHCGHSNGEKRSDDTFTTGRFC